MSRADRLAKRYRRLLLWYPRDYRLERGEEIVGVLLELARPGQSRPSVRQRVNLIRHGLRCRLGRPASRLVVVTALLASVVCGLFTAALATRVGWEAAEPLPGEAEAKAIFAELAPQYDFTERLHRSPAMWVIDEQPVSRATLRSLLFTENDYELGAVWSSATVAQPVRASRLTDRQRLQETGWSIDRVLEFDTGDYVLTAHRGADIVTVSLVPEPRGDVAYVGLTIRRATPWTVYAAGAAGGIVGALACWLVFGWASRRLEGRHPLASTMAIVFYAITMLMWWLPTIVFVPANLNALRRSRDTSWPPMWEWLGLPMFWRLFLAGCFTAWCVIAIAALPRRRHRLASGTARS